MIAKNDRCTGCSACAESCPKHCIEMREDSEGFLYPQVDAQRCINCNKCESVCPVLSDQCHKAVNYPKKAYAVINNDLDRRRISSSGGAFAMFAECVLASSSRCCIRCRIFFGFLRCTSCSHNRAFRVI